MKLMLKISIITFLSLVLTINAHAQFTPSVDGVTIQASNQNPKPGESVEISLESFSLDLTSSSIVWQVNGKTQNQGVGLIKTNVIITKIGIPVTISAIIKAPNGREVKKSITIKAGSVDMIWESLGYTPPFFNGKPSFVYQNIIHLIAMPHLSIDGSKELDPKTLVYKWKLGGKWIDNAQGYGIQSVDIRADIVPKPLEIEVEVYNREQTQNAIGNITLTPTDPSLSFYEEDSLYGILFNKALIGKIPLKNSEMKVRAVPYGFNINKIDSNNYIWSINNIEQTDLSKNQSITIKSKGDIEGSSNINLDIRNLSDILQSAKNGFAVYFSKKQVQETEQVTF